MDPVFFFPSFHIRHSAAGKSLCIYKAVQLLNMRSVLKTQICSSPVGTTSGSNWSRRWILFALVWFHPWETWVPENCETELCRNTRDTLVHTPPSRTSDLVSRWGGHTGPREGVTAPLRFQTGPLAPTSTGTPRASSKLKCHAFCSTCVFLSRVLRNVLGDVS